MKKFSDTILYFLIGFYGYALIFDNPEILKMKSFIFFIGVIISLILKKIYEKSSPNVVRADPTFEEKIKILNDKINEKI